MRQAVDKYIKENRHRKFKWGEFDCVIFALGAVEAQTGQPPVDLVRYPYNTAIGAQAVFRDMMNRVGVDDIMQLIDTVLIRCDHVPPTGGIVLKHTDRAGVGGFAIGIVSGNNGFFADIDGLRSIRLDPRTDWYWKVTP